MSAVNTWGPVNSWSSASASGWNVSGSWNGASSTAVTVTLIGIADGVHIVSFVNVTNPLVPVQLANHNIAFTGGLGSIDNATLGVTSGDAVIAVQLGSNPKTTGGVGWSVAT
jgi:hypothetical protein